MPDGFRQDPLTLPNGVPQINEKMGIEENHGESETWWAIDTNRLKDVEKFPDQSGATTSMLYFSGASGEFQKCAPTNAKLKSLPDISYDKLANILAEVYLEKHLSAASGENNVDLRTSPKQDRSKTIPSVWNSGKLWKVVATIHWTDDSKAFRMMAAAAVAAAASKTCVAPLERIKLIMQVHGMNAKVQPSSPGLRSVIKRVLMMDGPVGFFYGNKANIARIMPTKGVLFACNEYYRKLFNVSPVNPEPARLVTCGSAAGATATVCTYPLDVVRSRMMMMKAKDSSVKHVYSGITDCLRKTYRAEGFTGLFSGLGPTLCSIIPYAGVSFASFDLLKNIAPKDAHGHTPTFYKLVCGAASGFISQTVTYPMDTVRRRMQTQGMDETRLYRNSLTCISRMFKSEGILAFYRGVSTNLLRAAPNTALQFTVYEKVCQLLDIQKNIEL